MKLEARGTRELPAVATPVDNYPCSSDLLTAGGPSSGTHPSAVFADGSRKCRISASAAPKFLLLLSDKLRNTHQSS